MNDAHDQSGVSDAPATGGAVAISPGHWLRDERERQGLTLQRIAADMHLSVTIIEAIEQNRFAAVGAPVFARGYLRKYASLLQVPVNRIIELYDKLDDAPRDVDPIPLAQRAPEPALRPAIRQMFGAGGKNTSRRAPPLPWIFAVALLAVAAFAAAWFFGRTAPPSVPPAQQTESS